MAIGKNVNLKDRIIKSTVADESKGSKIDITNKASNTYNTGMKNKGSIINKVHKRDKDTEGTIKMTFYIKEDLYRKLRNFAYWDRHSITEAFNLVTADGLKGKEVNKTEPSR
ncbi:MAG: hypothetical protein KKH28_03625 [Elusimicrobia bacterium]|nr:hypothetical protein [Elusimicrobiota bacterium]